MKKVLSVSILTVITFIVLKGSGVLNALLFFILIGELPGTSHALSPSMTLTILTLTVGVIITYITLPSLFNTIETADIDTKKRKSRRRFSEI